LEKRQVLLLDNRLHPRHFFMLVEGCEAGADHRLASSLSVLLGEGTADPKAAPRGQNDCCDL
jgi:hypothetical protein